MTSYKSSFIFISLIFILPFPSDYSLVLPWQNLGKETNESKEIRQLVSKMKYVEGGSFTMGSTSFFSDISMTVSDSTLLIGGTPKRTVVDSYYIGATEVTNAEWREFYKAKVLEVGETKGKSEFYPDTSLWVTEFPYTYNAPHAKHYFSNPEYDDFPVVGITWDQANAYCQWKSDKLKALLVKAGIKQFPEFRLPSESEWEYAAIKNEKETETKSRSVYVWSEENLIGQINHLTNIGQIRDINNVILKQYGDDGCLYTCKVASFPPNAISIYDMAGNVSEWTKDPGYSVTIGLRNEDYRVLYGLDEINKEIERLKNDNEHVDIGLKERLLESLEHNKKILSFNDVKVCKGGSWACGMIYTQPGSRQGVRKGNASTKIGFRLVMSEVDKDVKKYFPKNHWKP